jgi:hypothetical protein
MQNIKNTLVYLHEDVTTFNFDVDDVHTMSKAEMQFAHDMIQKIATELAEASTKLEHIELDEEEAERMYFPNQTEALADL